LTKIKKRKNRFLHLWLYSLTYFEHNYNFRIIFVIILNTLAFAQLK